MGTLGLCRHTTGMSHAHKEKSCFSDDPCKLDTSFDRECPGEKEAAVRDGESTNDADSSIIINLYSSKEPAIVVVI